jgi:uncharacterized membrane protein
MTDVLVFHFAIPALIVLGAAIAEGAIHSMLRPDPDADVITRLTGRIWMVFPRNTAFTCLASFTIVVGHAIGHLTAPGVPVFLLIALCFLCAAISLCEFWLHREDEAPVQAGVDGASKQRLLRRFQVIMLVMSTVIYCAFTAASIISGSLT